MNIDILRGDPGPEFSNIPGLKPNIFWRLVGLRRLIIRILRLMFGLNCSVNILNWLMIFLCQLLALSDNS